MPFKAIASEDLRFSEELRQHGLRVINTVREVVDKIHDQDAVVTHLHELGRKHVMLNAKPDYIDVRQPHCVSHLIPKSL